MNPRANTGKVLSTCVSGQLRNCLNYKQTRRLHQHIASLSCAEIMVKAAIWTLSIPSKDSCQDSAEPRHVMTVPFIFDQGSFLKQACLN